LLSYILINHQIQHAKQVGQQPLYGLLAVTGTREKHSATLRHFQELRSGALRIAVADEVGWVALFRQYFGRAGADGGDFDTSRC